MPTGFSLWKQVDGNLNMTFTPRDPKRDPKLFVAAFDALTAAQTRLSKHLAGPFENADDNPATFKKRLETYRAQTAPVAQYYANKGILKTVDGMQPIDDVSDEIFSHLK